MILLVLVGCSQDMASQPAYRPLRGAKIFGDGRSARPQVEGTIARGQLRDDPHRFEGKRPGLSAPQAAGLVAALSTGPSLPFFLDLDPLADRFPMPLTSALLARGEERFNIFCAMCHDRTGGGDGIVVKRGYAKPPTYHSDRLRKARVGYLFEVITHGFGAMPEYASQIPTDDRWAIIAYVRALQLSQNASLADVPEAKEY